MAVYSAFIFAELSAMNKTYIYVIFRLPLSLGVQPSRLPLEFFIIFLNEYMKSLCKYMYAHGPLLSAAIEIYWVNLSEYSHFCVSLFMNPTICSLAFYNPTFNT